MFEIEFESTFKKDYKRAEKKKRNIKDLETVLKLLRKDGTLPAKYKSHSLKGNWKGYKEAHIENDWLIIWREKGNIITLSRMGSHDELFK